MAAVLGASFAYLRYMAKHNRSSLQLRDEVMYRFARELSGPLYEVREGIAAGDLARLKGLDDSLAQALISAEDALGRLDAHAPLAAYRALQLGLRCRACAASIRPGETYWAMDLALADAEQLGNYRNDIHCAACHSGPACDLCAAYARSPLSAA
jgi:hypothetical protein